MIGIEFVLSLLVLAVLGALMNLVAAREHRLARGEPVRKGHLRGASIFFLTASLVAVWTLFLFMVMQVAMGLVIIPRTIIKIIEHQFEVLLYLLLIPPGLVISWGFAKLARGIRLREDFEKEAEELQESLVLQLIQTLDFNGIRSKDLIGMLSPRTIAQKDSETLSDLAKFLSKLIDEPMYKAVVTWAGANELFDVLAFVVPTSERLRVIIEELIAQEKVIETDNGYLVSDKNLGELLRSGSVMRKRQGLLEYLREGKKYRWVKSRNGR